MKSLFLCYLHFPFLLPSKSFCNRPDYAINTQTSKSFRDSSMHVQSNEDTFEAMLSRNI